MTTATTTTGVRHDHQGLTLAPSRDARPPRRPRYRPEVAPTCPHCGRLGSARYSVHVGGLCVRLVADHTDRAELVGGVKMRPVELVVNGEPRWLWTRHDVDAMDVDDLVVMFQTFEPPPPQAPRRVVDGGTTHRPEPVALFVGDVTPPRPTPPAASAPPAETVTTKRSSPAKPAVRPRPPSW